MSEKLSGKYANWYFYCLLLFALSLPFSKFGLSLSQLLILIIWLFEGKFISKWKQLISNKLVLSLIAIYAIHLLGLLYTENFEYALKDLRIKLPLLSFSVFASWIFPLAKKQLKLLLDIFIAAVSFAAIIGMYRVFFIELEDIRDASIFVSHIRFALMICVAVFISFYYLMKQKVKWPYLLSNFVLLTSLVVMQSMTGVVVLSAAIVFVGLYTTLKSSSWLLKVGLPLLIVSALSIPAYFIFTEIKDFQNVELLGPQEKLPYTSPGGEVYYHKIESTLHENGTLIWSYVAIHELERSWERASNLGFREHDAKGQPVYSTLMRYMSSKGLHKDSVDFQKLSPMDIKLIEDGYTNYRFIDDQGFSRRIYETLWELENYKNGENVEGNSLAQRAVFWQTGYSILKDNLWFGIGTGDIRDAFETAYLENKTDLSKRFRLRTHNQYLTIAITFGIIGLLIFILAFFAPLFSSRNNFLFSLFILCAALSFVTEDTLETQVGISFIVFFYCVFGLNSFPSLLQHKE